MKLARILNLSDFYDLMVKKVIPDIGDDDDRLAVARFVDKISDSDAFVQKVHQIFNSRKMAEIRELTDQIQCREVIQIPSLPQFEIRPEGPTNWTLYHNNQVFLSDLSDKLVRKILIDINAAILIKCNRLVNGKEY